MDRSRNEQPFCPKVTSDKGNAGLTALPCRRRNGCNSHLQHPFKVT